MAAQAAAGAQAALAAAGGAEGLLESAKAANAPEVEEAIEAYVDQLRDLTDTLGRVREQAARMSTDSVEMENLNRTLTGINTIYEMQLKSISQQVGTIDDITEQTHRLAKQIEELNGVYARMIEALTVNMPKTAQA
jgi:chromosome segregation ATPase